MSKRKYRNLSTNCDTSTTVSRTYNMPLKLSAPLKQSVARRAVVVYVHSLVELP